MVWIARKTLCFFQGLIFMKKIKIAFCLRDMHLGGVESVLIRTLDKLQKYKNIDISMITYVDINEPVYVEYFKQHPNIKCYSLYPSKWLGTKLPHFFLWRLIIHFLRDIYRNFKRIFVMEKFKDFDVFIDYHDFGFDAELKKIKNAKKIAWFHSSVNVFHDRNFVNKIDGYDKVVVLTDEFIDEFKKLYPNKKHNLIRIYNPIDINSVKNRADEKDIKITGDYFCAVSRLSFDKDIKTLLNGFDLFWNLNNQPDVKLVIVGDGNKRGEYENYAKSLKSAKQVVFVGMQKNPFVYMKNARANILSSFGEGLPTVLMESSVVSVLNISSDCKCGPREILLDGDAGLLFEPGDFGTLAKYMSDVYHNKVDVKKMVDESTKALQRFDNKIITKQVKSLIP